MKQEDATTALVDWIKQDCPSQYPPYGYEVYIPNLITRLVSEGEDSREISAVLFDAAWELCRRGIIRPGIKTIGAQSTDQGGSGAGFSLTAFGRKWIEESDDIFVPTEPERFAEMLEPYKKRFGPGFFERSQQAIRCYGAHAYLACCAMCGATAESIMLAVAITKTGDETKVLKTYRSASGRHRVEDMVIGQSSKALKREFSGLTSLLKYWRDEAAHGESSGIGDNEAYTSLVMLLRFTMFVDRYWSELTG